MTKFKKLGISVLSAVLCASMIASVANGALRPSAKDGEVVSNKTYVSRITESIKSNREDYFSSDVVFKLPDTLSPDDEVSVIVAMSAETVLDAYGNTDGTQTLKEFASSEAAAKVAGKAAAKRASLIKILDASGVNYNLGVAYDTILSGFEITIKAGDFDYVNGLLYDSAALIVGETY